MENSSSDLRYDYELDMNNNNSSHVKLLKLVGNDKDVLEIGPATGYLTRYLKEELHCRVTAIEIDAEAARVAGQYAEAIFVGDVENLDLNNILENKAYDVIVFADVLEHLKDPKQVLLKLKSFLKPDGYLLISIPNGTHGSIGLELLDGRFEYQATGLLDNTHLRFFSRHTFLRLLEEAGFWVTGLDRVIMEPWNTELATLWKHYPREITAYVEKANPDYSTYQFIIKASFMGMATELEMIRDALEQSVTDKEYWEKKYNMLKTKALESEETITERTQWAQSLDKQLEERTNWARSLEKQLEERTKWASSLDSQLAERTQWINSLMKQLDENTEWISRLNEQVHSLQEKEAWAASLDLQLRNSEKEREIMLNSKSWRMTEPLRKSRLAIDILKTEGIVSLLGRVKRKYFDAQKKQPFVPDPVEIQENWEPLVFPEVDNPLVSIIIPVYNNYAYTFNCLKSIIKSTGGDSYEIVVVDDCSQDETPQMLGDITGIRVHRNKENAGFINSCNNGANISKGKFLVFLNNDTTVTDGWLGALLQTFENFPDAGLVGAKLVYPDGRLQEAGGIVWKDGSAWNYGRLDDSTKCEYNYVRDVDYCSGACLMIEKTFFEQLGQFDTFFAPAYYEDTDLAFRVRNAARRVLYQPGAVIIHYEGITSGTSISSGVKKYQQINFRKFYERWHEALTGHRINGSEPYLEKDRNISSRILVIDARMLLPDQDSGSLRMFNLLKVFRELSCHVTFMPRNLQYLSPYSEQLQAIGTETIYVPHVRSVTAYLEEYGRYFDYVILSRAEVAEFHIDDVKKYCNNAKVIFDTVDLHYLRELRAYELEKKDHLKKAAMKRKEEELSFIRKADMTFVVSPVEKEVILKELPDSRIEIVSNIHQIYGRGSAFEDRKDILFIGGFEHYPNTDGVTHFVKNIFPRILTDIPDMKFYIIGSKAPKTIRNLSSENVIVMGYVEDVGPLFDNIRLTVAPLRYGAGVKGKINMSMGYGVPVVATAVAAEGMYLSHDQDICIAETDGAFADAVVQVYENKDLWQKLSDNGVKNIEKYFSFETAKENLKQILDN
jgi:GT2 family glycosyltransferase/2-polyprenyl-3-methyl-5-hydroxy-6-metoxy-1,4-benzoquinol methylase